MEVLVLVLRPRVLVLVFGLVLFTSLLFVSNRICATEVIFYNNNKNNNNKAIGCLFESVSAGNKRPGCTIKDGQCVEKL